MFHGGPSLKPDWPAMNKTVQPVFYTIKEVSTLLGVSARSVLRLSDGKHMPRVIRVGSLLRWKREDVDDWIEKGCPKR